MQSESSGKKEPISLKLILTVFPGIHYEFLLDHPQIVVLSLYKGGTSFVLHSELTFIELLSCQVRARAHLG